MEAMNSGTGFMNLMPSNNVRLFKSKSDTILTYITSSPNKTLPSYNLYSACILVKEVGSKVKGYH